MEDRELFSRLRELGGGITPPESLDPGAVGETLRGVRKKRPAARAAAVCALFLVLALSAAMLTSDLNGGGLITPAPAPAQAAKEQNNSYDTIYNTISRAKKAVSTGLAATGDAQSSLAEESTKFNFDDYGDAAATAKQHTNTNEQVAGVQEGDIVKTDGEYIYTVNGKDLMVFRAENGKATKLAAVLIAQVNQAGTKNETTVNPLELFISGDYIAVICSESAGAGGYNYTEEYVDCGMANSISTLVLVYDVSDRSDPKLISTLKQSGDYLTSRMAGNTLYLVSNYFVPNEEIKKDKPETFVPLLTSGGQSRPVDSRDISIAKAKPQAQYTTITSVDIQNPTDFKSNKSVMGGGTSLYCNTESLYLGVFVYDNASSVPRTQLLKYSLNGGDIVLNSEAEVDGTLLNQFSMDESGGYFRVATSYTKIKEERKDGAASATLLGEVQKLYVLDKNLAVCGTFENQSKNERLKSVRFVGDYAYFVTFEQTDPLFSVDLGDPHNPRLLGALEIPGFFQYLHPYGENRLLGFGVDANEDGITKGLKLSMFDTADKADVKEIAVLRFADNTSFSPAQYNHKAIMFDQQDNLIGIPVVHEGSAEYYLFAYSEADGFVQKARLSTQGGASGSEDNVRGLIIGDYFYLCDAPDIISYPVSDFS